MMLYDDVILVKKSYHRDPHDDEIIQLKSARAHLLVVRACYLEKETVKKNGTFEFNKKMHIIQE